MVKLLKESRSSLMTTCAVLALAGGLAAQEERGLPESMRRPWGPLVAVGRPAHGVIHAELMKFTRLFPSDRHLPDNLQGQPHIDYVPAFQWVPRGITTFQWGHPEMLLGNQESYEYGSPKPIGERGSFQISRYPELPFPLSWAPLYFSFTTPDGTHGRLGARWDDVDFYTNMPSIAIKRNVE